MLVRTQTDLPLARDAASRYLPWIIAAMVYLAGLSIAGAIAVTETVDHWRAGIKGSMTVQIPAATKQATVRQVLQRLQKTPGVVRARLLSQQEIRGLVRPWFDQSPGTAKLALPQLIDVMLKQGVRPDMKALQKSLAARIPEIRIVDHQRWLGKVATAALAARWFAIAIVLLIGAAAMLTIVFAARTGLNIHRKVVDILHIMGARDRYIARQFQRQAFWLGFRGGALGTLGVALTVLAIGQAARMLGFGVPLAVLEPLHWVPILAMPIVVALISRQTARTTIMRTLARMS